MASMVTYKFSVNEGSNSISWTKVIYTYIYLFQFLDYVFPFPFIFSGWCWICTVSSILLKFNDLRAMFITDFLIFNLKDKKFKRSIVSFTTNGFVGVSQPGGYGSGWSWPGSGSGSSHRKTARIRIWPHEIHP